MVDLILNNFFWYLGVFLVVSTSIIFYVAYAILRRIDAKTGMTGEEVARKMLDDYGIDDVKINLKRENYYSIDDREIGLTKTVFYGRGIASLAIATHECGHAIQHAKGDKILQIQIKTHGIYTFINIITLILYIYNLIVFSPSMAVFFIIYCLNGLWYGLLLPPNEEDASFIAIDYLIPILKKRRYIQYANFFLKIAKSTYIVNNLFFILMLIEYTGILMII